MPSESHTGFTYVYIQRRLKPPPPLRLAKCNEVGECYSLHIHSKKKKNKKKMISITHL